MYKSVPELLVYGRGGNKAVLRDRYGIVNNIAGFEHDINISGTFDLMSKAPKELESIMKGEGWNTHPKGMIRKNLDTRLIIKHLVEAQIKLLENYPKVGGPAVGNNQQLLDICLLIVSAFNNELEILSSDLLRRIIVTVTPATPNEEAMVVVQGDFERMSRTMFQVHTGMDEEEGEHSRPYELLSEIMNIFRPMDWHLEFSKEEDYNLLYTAKKFAKEDRDVGGMISPREIMQRRGQLNRIMERWRKYAAYHSNHAQGFAHL